MRIRFFAVLGLLFLFGCGGGGGGGDTPNGPLAAVRLYGLNFSPYLDGQSPSLGTQISQSQLRSRMQQIAADTQWIRTFSCRNGHEKAGAVAHQLRLKAAIGAFLSRDMTANEEEINNLIRVGQSGEADLLIVGSETLLRGDLSESQLIGYINRVKQALPNRTVTTADTFDQILRHPQVVAACDTVLVNYYPYWNRVNIEQAIATVQGWHQQVKAAAGGKEVLVSETGWPWAGNAQGGAVASPENAVRYLRDFVAWANANQVGYFYFAAFDESWKAAVEGPQGAHWGLRDTNGTLKPGVDAVFKLQLTRVPPYGSTAMLQGKAGLVTEQAARLPVQAPVR